MRPWSRDPLTRARADLTERLGGHLREIERRTRTPAIGALVDQVIAQVGSDAPADAPLVAALVAAADAAFGAVLRIETTAGKLTVAYQGATTRRAQRDVLEKHLRETTQGKRLRHDLSALERFLDLEALQERLSIRIADQIDQIEVAYAVAGKLVAGLPEGAERLSALGGGNVVTTAFKHALSGRREPIRCAALRFLSDLLACLPSAERLRTLGAQRFRQVAAWATMSGTSRWVQVASLTLTATASIKMAKAVFTQLLASAERAEPDDRDGMIVRRNVVRLIGEHDLPVAEALALARTAADDPSEYVRQELCILYAGLPGEASLLALRRSALDDASVRVRGVAVRSLCSRALCEPGDAPGVADVLEAFIAQAKTATDVAVALESVTRVCCGARAPCQKGRFVSGLSELMRREETPPAAAEEAAALLRRLEVESAPALAQVAERFATLLAELPEGGSRRIALPDTLRLRDVEYALATAARGDLSVSLRALGRGRYRVRRGEPRGFRLWRLLHELVTPAPDKRKAFDHTHGRKTRPGSVVPTHLLAEVTPTRVPGERRLKPHVGGWAPFLPRVDDLLAATSLFADPVRLVTSIGVVTVAGPRGLLSRLRAWLYVTFRYAHLDRLRDRALSAVQDAQKGRFVEACRELGFRITLGDTAGSIEGEGYDAAVPRVAKYLSPLMLPDIRHHTDAFVQYTLSPTGNTPFHLAGLVWLVLSGFIVRAAWIMGCIERARRAIPITVGGWGTRGKSGTERLKAALFHAMRYDVVVKTTGCEAMFIHARRDLPAREIFIYRPYDKATIWEQRKVLEFGAGLGAQVFLWECMALNPRFVQVLNRDWMQDPVTTLTNAYPDHEDVMGPSGEDVARVIGLFMPRRGTTYTAEEQMLPILRELARRSGTQLHSVSPLDADLLPKDLLDRYPYDEHPRNIALVLALAAHFGIEREFAIVEMGDRVVPDLGVLKTYPEVSYLGRALVFSNGMSANERAGFLSNWTRLGFDKLDPDGEPTTVSIAVVNNRADRVPRSRVFAELLTRDVCVTGIVLIGTNLDGMQQFLREALDVQLADLDLSGCTSADEALASLDPWLAKLAAPRTRTSAANQVRAMIEAALSEEVAAELLGGEDFAEALSQMAPRCVEIVQAKLPADEGFRPGNDRDNLLAHVGAAVSRFVGIEEVTGQVRELVEAGRAAEATAVARKGVSQLLMARVSALPDAGAKGDQVVHFAARAVPPGHHARLLGCQNIKGTGLDFVYRWLSVGAVTEMLDGAERVPEQRAEGITSLTTYKDYGILDVILARARVEAWLERQDESWQQHAQLLESARDHLRTLYTQKQKGLSATRKKGLIERLLDRGVEPLLDHWDSTRRTKAADRVMTDLFAVRVGQGRAALLLRDIVARQKGGWLARSLVRRKG